MAGDRKTMSRRDLLGGTAILALQALGAMALIPRAAAQQKVSKAEAKYQTEPRENGLQRCGICLQFEPPNQCRIVEGPISPKGWCQFFAARENAR